MVIKRNNLKPSEYMKFVEGEYLVEIIPDFMPNDKHPDMIVVVTNVNRLSGCYSTPGAHCARHIFKIPTAGLTSKEPITSNQHYDYDDNKTIVISFVGRMWIRHVCTSGTLKITIIDGEESEKHGNCNN